MGLFHSRPTESATLSTSVLRLPFTDFTAQLGHCDGDEICLPFQLRYVDCCEAYGYMMAKEKCKFYYQDFVECARRWKRDARVNDMKAQHYYLWFQGLLGNGPKVPRHYEYPRLDGYMPWMILCDVNHK